MLPIDLLRNLHSVIDLTNGNLIVTPGGSGSEIEFVPMVTLASGHQALEIHNFSTFPEISVELTEVLPRRDTRAFPPEQ